MPKTRSSAARVDRIENSEMEEADKGIEQIEQPAYLNTILAKSEFG